VVALLGWAFVEGRAELLKEGEMEAPIKAPHHLAYTPAGATVVILDAQAQRRIALKTKSLTDTTLQPSATAYGVLEADPMLSFTLRAPMSGILLATPSDSSARWPDLGTMLSDGMVIGAVQPLLGPVERVDLASRLAQAQANVAEHRALLKAAESSLEHKEALNATVQVLPQRTLEALAAEVESEKAQVAAAQQTVSLISAALATQPRRPAPISTTPVQIVHGGEVVELAARPGEVVGQGQAILRVARFDHLVARVELPAGVSLATTARGARIVVLGYEDHPLMGETIGTAPRVRANTRGQAFLFRVARGGLAIRPGAAVTAYLELPGELRHGVVVPREAVIRSAGSAWVFVQTSDEQFVQRQMTLDEPTLNGWFIQSGFSAGQRVVVTGAQMLLSEILKSQIRVGEEEERQ